MTTDDSSTEIGSTAVEPAQGAMIDANPNVAPQPTTASFVPAAVSASNTPGRPPVRVGTIVWGLVFAAIGVFLLAIAAGARIDSGLAAIGLLAGSGIALLIGALVASSRRHQRG
jgi:hypothetical protein